MNTTQKYYYVGWEQLYSSSQALAWRLQSLGPWKGIVAVTRGGLIPAAIVARELDLRHIETATVMGRRTEDKNQNNPKQRSVETKYPINIGRGEGWLVVDDLVDTGRTAGILRPLLPKAHFAAVYAKPMGRPLVETFVTEVSQDTWIFFPWDKEEEAPQAKPDRRKPLA